MKRLGLAVGVISLVVVCGSTFGQSLTTAPSNNGSGGIFLDLTPASQTLLVTGFDVSYTGTAGTIVDVEVWTRQGSYVGFDGDPTGWTLTQTVQGMRGGTLVWTPLPLSVPIDLPSGQTTGICLQVISAGGGIRYTGTGTAPPQTTWANADLTLFSDVARVATVAFTGTRFTPRTFSGVIYYEVGGCYADCDTSTGIGVLDIFDFLCYGNRFSANDPYACDCDTSTGVGVCDIFDFLCFGNAFNAGCP